MIHPRDEFETKARFIMFILSAIRIIHYPSWAMDLSGKALQISVLAALSLESARNWVNHYETHIFETSTTWATEQKAANAIS